MKKVLLIGGGIGQLPIAQRLRERPDVVLIVVAYHCIEAVRDLAHKVIYHDLFDLDGVLEIAKSEAIEAVISDQHDLFVPTVAYISEALGIPGNKFNQVQTYCDKNRFRVICDRLHVPVPRHQALNDAKQLVSLKFPIVVKPADAQSSLGISKVTDTAWIQDAVDAALKYSRTGFAIAEEFFEGREIVSEGLIYNGKYFNLSFGDRIYFQLKNMFIPAQTLFPSTIPKYVAKKIVAYESAIAAEVKPSFAIVHTEWLWNEETDEMCCVESALRGGGVYISSDIIPKCTGLDINSLLIDFALGKSIDIPEFLSKKKNAAAGYLCFYLHEGEIVEIDGIDALKKNKGVNKIFLDNLSVGTEVQKLTHKGQRYGPILISSINRKGLDALIRNCQDTLKITIKEGNKHYFGPNWM